MLVFVDTNVWYPVVLADLVLRSVEIGLFDLAWTDESLAKVERVLVEHRRRPAMAPDDILDRFDALGLSVMVGVLRQRDRPAPRSARARAWVLQDLPQFRVLLGREAEVGRHLAKFSLKFRVRPGRERQDPW